MRRSVKGTCDYPYRRETEPPGSTRVSLIDGLKADAPPAFDRLASVYAPQIFRWIVFRHRVSQEDAEDLVQDVLLEIRRSIRNFRGDRPGDTFRGWVFRIAENQTIDHLRRVGDEPVAVGQGRADFESIEAGGRDDGCPDADDLPPADDALSLRAAVEAARARVGAATWGIFKMHVIEERPAVEVAANFGRTVGNVYLIKHQVLNRIRGHLLDLVRDEFAEDDWRLFEGATSRGGSVEATAQAAGVPVGQVEAVVARILKRIGEVGGGLAL